MIKAGDRTWITASEAFSYWPDVTSTAVRSWAHDGKVSGHRIGREVYYDLAQLSEVEKATRTSRRGNKRTRVLTCDPLLTS